MKKALFLFVLVFFAIIKADAQTSIGPVFNFARTPFDAYGPVETLYKTSVTGGAVLQFSRGRHRFLTGLEFVQRKGDWGRNGRWPSQHNQTNPGTWDPNLPSESIIETEIGLFTPAAYRFVFRKKGRVLPFFELGGAVGLVKTKYGDGDFSAENEWQGVAKTGLGLEISAKKGRLFLLAGGQKKSSFRSQTASFSSASENWDAAFSPFFEAGWLFDLGKKIAD